MLPDRRTSRAAPRLAGAALAACGALASAAHAQSIEPRAYSPAPVGVNFLIVGYASTHGGLAFDSSVPLTNPQLRVQGPVFGYARSFDLLGRLAKFDAILPTARLKGTADYQGQPVEREVQGLMDPLLRLSVDLYGTPAMSVEQFRLHQQDVIVGASVQVSAPLGQYDRTRLLNLGANRWSFHPELGVSKAFGNAWVVEFAGGATFYTANDDFFNGNRRSQAPIYSARTNLIYNFRSGPWVSLDATWYTGGETTLDGQSEGDLQRNWRLGTTFAMPVNRRVSLKLNASRGVSARTGNNYDLLGVALQYRWGAGL